MEIQATSSNAPGFLAAIVSNVRAAPEGLRRPCSHSCNVRTDTPNSAANSACDKPVRVRMSDIAGKGLTRPTFLRLSSRSPSRISRPMFRPRTALAVDLISDLPEDVSRDVFNDIFCIKSKQPYFFLGYPKEVNDSDSGALAATRDTPTHFPDTARPGNHFPQFRVVCQHLLQARVVVIGKVRLNETREKSGFDETDHDVEKLSASIRQCRIPTMTKQLPGSSSQSNSLRIRPLHEVPEASEYRRLCE
jgi:hypothetical protein